ncbi:MAG: Ig-like domain-containing protein, partial [Fulvivirga sp.]|nr:Ig-like domain-containing protein [Fulvivirga sp.]
MVRIIKTVIYLITLIILAQCANVRQPTGGDKDEIPPELTDSTPSHESLNYSGTEITLTFNEAVKLKNAKKQLLITPRIDQEYEIKARKEKVFISFENPLDSNTTYTFNFRQGIQDLNEGNPADNLKLAFSTGNYLDSMQITGHVNNILTNTPAKQFIVALYLAQDTLNPLEDPPLYLTKTNDEGKFALENLKQNRYLLYTYNDQNNNLTLEAQSEAHGFYPDTINLTKNYDSLYLNAYAIDDRPLTFEGTRQSGTVMLFRFNKYLTELKLNTPGSFPLYYNFDNHAAKQDELNTSVQVFSPEEVYTDSIQVTFNAVDSLRQRLIDSTFIQFAETNR